jgi:hypothetical protein
MFNEIIDERFIVVIDNLFFSDLTLDKYQMMVIYGEDGEDNEDINIIDIGMINYVI